ncbi:endonuclease III, partial [Candidatus Bathyarchaeota archaeon]|nr:endonuclease III [Candidatus Bathyarchaeota archaeon]
YNGDLSRVFQLPLDEARATLMDIKGIGPKTADVFLASVGKYPVMPVDTNIFRVVDRIGIAKGRNYERTRKILERLISSEKLMDAHIYLIMLGREICKPYKPLCPSCPINSQCDYGTKSIEDGG